MTLLKARLSAPECHTLHGLFCSTPAALTVELIAAAGYDFVVIDLEHTLIDGTQLSAMLLAARASDIAVLVRVAGAHQVAPVLDAGAQGIVFPRIAGAGQAKRAAALCHYAQHPLGPRSIPGQRGLNATWHSAYGRDELATAVTEASRHTLVVAMIEDGAALDALDEISAVPGIDILLEGAADLSQALGVPWQTRHPLVRDAVVCIADAARRHGKVFCALPRTPEDTTFWHEQGTRMLLLGDDRGITRRAMAAHLQSHSSPPM